MRWQVAHNIGMWLDSGFAQKSCPNKSWLECFREIPSGKLTYPIYPTKRKRNIIFTSCLANKDMLVPWKVNNFCFFTGISRIMEPQLPSTTSQHGVQTYPWLPPKNHQKFTHRRDTTRLMAVCVSSVVLRVSLLGTNLLTWSGIIETNDPKKTAMASSGGVYISIEVATLGRPRTGLFWNSALSSCGQKRRGDLEMLAKGFTKNMSGKINLNRNPVDIHGQYFAYNA